MPAKLSSISDTNASLGASTSQEVQKDAKMVEHHHPTLKGGIAQSSLAVSSCRCDLEGVVK